MRNCITSAELAAFKKHLLKISKNFEHKKTFIESYSHILPKRNAKKNLKEYNKIQNAIKLLQNLPDRL